MSNNSVKFHRVLKATPEKVYRAFTTANAMSFWLPPYGFLCVVHEMDARVDGGFKMSFKATTNQFEDELCIVLGRRTPIFLFIQKNPIKIIY